MTRSHLTHSCGLALLLVVTSGTVAACGYGRKPPANPEGRPPRAAITAEPVDLVVRPYNMKGDGKDIGGPASLARRLRQGAARFFDAWPREVGLLAVQEAGDDHLHLKLPPHTLPDCSARPGERPVNRRASECFRVASPLEGERARLQQRTAQRLLLSMVTVAQRSAGSPR